MSERWIYVSTEVAIRFFRLKLNEYFNYLGNHEQLRDHFLRVQIQQIGEIKSLKTNV